MASVSGHLTELTEADVKVEASSPGSRNEESSSFMRNSDLNDDEESVMSCYKTLQWLEAEVDQHKTQLNIIKNMNAMSEDEPSADRTEELQQKLTQMMTDRSILKSIMHSIVLGQELIDLLFRSNAEMHSKAQTSVTELVEQATTSASNVLRIHKETEALQSELRKVHDECRVLRQESRVQMSKLQKLKEDRLSHKNTHTEDLAVKRLQKENEVLTAEVDLAQFCLQGLIFGSGVNWAQDKKLSKLALSLGQPIDKLIKDFKEMTVHSDSTPSPTD